MGGWAVIVVGCGLFCAAVVFKPRFTRRSVGGRPKRWHLGGPEPHELTDAPELVDGAWVLRPTMLALVALVLIAAGIWIVATEDEQECKRIMSDLTEAGAGADFDRDSAGEPSDVLAEEAADDKARSEMHRTAAMLDVELREHRESIEVVDADGRSLGTIDQFGEHHRCG